MKHLLISWLLSKKKQTLKVPSSSPPCLKVIQQCICTVAFRGNKSAFELASVSEIWTFHFIALERSPCGHALLWPRRGMCGSSSKEMRRDKLAPLAIALVSVFWEPAYPVPRRGNWDRPLMIWKHFLSHVTLSGQWLQERMYQAIRIHGCSLW